jgi:hypothetical protein
MATDLMAKGIPLSKSDSCLLWSKLDPNRYPFVRSLARQLPVHDDRKDFLAGIDLILRGIDSRRRDRHAPALCRGPTARGQSRKSGSENEREHRDNPT